jgi:hypothetical protein
MEFSSCSLLAAEYLKQELEIHKKKKKPSTGETIMTRVELAVLKQDQERKSEIGTKPTPSVGKYAGDTFSSQNFTEFS